MSEHQVELPKNRMGNCDDCGQYGLLTRKHTFCDHSTDDWMDYKMGCVEACRFVHDKCGSVYQRRDYEGYFNDIHCTACNETFKPKFIYYGTPFHAGHHVDCMKSNCPYLRKDQIIYE